MNSFQSQIDKWEDEYNKWQETHRYKEELDCVDLVLVCKKQLSRSDLYIFRGI